MTRRWASRNADAADASKRRTHYFVVKGSQAESDLSRMEEEKWTVLAREVNLKRVEPGRSPVVWMYTSG